MHQDSNEVYKSSQDLYIQSIINWMKNDKLNLQPPPQKIEDLYTGTIFFDLLINAEPSKFNDNKVIKDKFDFQTINANLGELLEQLYPFYCEQEFLRPFNYGFIDTKNIAIQNEKAYIEILKLAELVIGALVFSSQNQIFVSAIQDLDITGQEYIAKIIELRSANDDIDQSPSNINDNNQNYNLLEKLDEKEIEVQNAISRIQQLESKLNEYKVINKGLNQTIEEKDSIIQELNEKITNIDSESQQIDPQAVEELNKQWQQKIEDIQQDYQNQIQDLKTENDQIYQQLKDQKKKEDTYLFYKEKFEEYTKKNDKYTSQGQDLALTKKKLQDSEKELKLIQQKLETQKKQIQSGNIDYILEIQKKDEQILDQSQKIQNLQQKIDEISIPNEKLDKNQNDDFLPKRGNLNLKEELQQEAVNLSFLNPSRTSHLFESQIENNNNQNNLNNNSNNNLFSQNQQKSLFEQQQQQIIQEQTWKQEISTLKEQNQDLQKKLEKIVQNQEKEGNISDNENQENNREKQTQNKLELKDSEKTILQQKNSQQQINNYSQSSENNYNNNINSNLNLSAIKKNNLEIQNLQDKLDQVTLENKKIWQAYMENTFVYEEELQLMVSVLTDMRLQMQEKQLNKFN